MLVTRARVIKDFTFVDVNFSDYLVLWSNDLVFQTKRLTVV